MLQDSNKSISRWVKWVIVLLALRRDRAIRWASFLSLNPLIKRAIERLARKSSDYDVMVSQLSNLISSGLLFLAIVDNPKIPSDYGVVYVFSNYIGELNPPSHSQILVTPKSSRYFKLSYYKSPKLRYLYDNKHMVLFPMLFAQILSNYLTPTTYKLNQRYLSSAIKSRILNPIWINYSLSHSTISLNILRLMRNYILHNLAFMGIYGVMTFKKRVLDHYYELKHNVYNANKLSTFNQVLLNYVSFIFNKANSITNFIYLPNLLSMLLISLTSSSMKMIYKSPHRKVIFKSYIKLIGFISAFITMVANSKNLIPAIGYTPTNYDEIDEDDETNIRTISGSFFNALNLYLIKLIILQKWRILKENHPIFQAIKLKYWNRFESLLFSIGVFKLMNLNDFLKFTKGKDYGIKENSMIKLIDRIM